MLILKPRKSPAASTVELVPASLPILEKHIVSEKLASELPVNIC